MISISTRMLARIQLATVAAALVYLFAVLPHTILSDGATRFTAMTTLMTTGDVEPMRYSYVGPLFSAPAWLFPGRQWWVWWCERYNTLLLAGGAVALWLLWRPALSASTRATFLLLLVAAGMMPHHVIDYYGEVFTTIAVAVGLTAVFVCNASWGWILVVLGVANMPASAIGLAFVAAWRAWKQRRFDGLIALAVAAAIILGENLIVRGGFLETGYVRDRGHRTIMPFSGRPGFSYPFALGVLSLIFSFGKGILFFSPGLVVLPAIRKQLSERLRDFADATSLFLAGLVIVYAKWWAWYGGWYWGPRFLLFAVIPSAFALAVVVTTRGSTIRYAIAAALVCWTAWVGISGVVWGQITLEACMENTFALEHLCWYVPEFSPLFRPFYLNDWSRMPLAQLTWMMIGAVAAILTLLAPQNSLDELS